MDRQFDNYQDHDIIEIRNESTGSAGYVAAGKVVILDPFTTRKVPYKELYEVVNTGTGRSMFEAGVFVCLDNAINEHFGLPLNGKYHPTADAIIQLFGSGTVEDMEELLQYCSEHILNKIVELAINLPLENLTFAKMIQDYSGKPVLSAIEEYQNDNLSSVELNKNKSAVKSRNITDDDKPVARAKKVVK